MRRIIVLVVALLLPSVALAGFAIFQVASGFIPPAVTWTALAPTGTSCGTGNNTCIIYVDNTGGQGNDGTCAIQSPPVTNTPSAGTQCATIAKAVTLLRTGKPDR
jgi:hypothetical protein